MKKFIFELKEISNYVTTVISNGEVAGYISFPESEHHNQQLFAITQNGKEMGYRHCLICAIESIIRRYEQIPVTENIDLITPKVTKKQVKINLITVH